MIIPYVHLKTKLQKLVLGLSAILLTSLVVHAQGPAERHARIKAAMDSGDVKTALAELNASRISNPDLFGANNYDYLLGRLSERTVDSATAQANYQSVVARNSVLSQYALWHLAQLARSTGDLPLERERLRQMTILAPATLLRDAATMRLGQSFLESKDSTAAIAALRPLSESSSRSTSREALALLGEALLRAGKPEEARGIFRRLVMQMPDASRPDDFALAGVRGLDLLDSDRSVGSQTPQLAESEHLLRASVYHFNRDFDSARQHYVAVIDRFPQSPTVANAVYQLGRGFYLQARYDEALKHFQRVLDEFPQSSSAPDALSFTAGAYNRLKRTDDAVAGYRRFIDRFPDAPNPERPYLNIVDALHEAGRLTEALEWVQKTRARFKGQTGDALGLFAQTRIHLAQNSWATVVADTTELRQFSDLGGVRVPGGTTRSEVTFLRAYALERLRKSDEAVSEYLTIPDGRNEYYGKLATQRIVAMARDPATRSLIETRAHALRKAAEQAINGGQVEPGRRMAQDALRLTEDTALRDETLELVLRAYDSIPSYKLPSLNLLPLGRQDPINRAPDANTSTATTPTHFQMAEELFFLGLYDEGVPEFATAQKAAKVENAAASKSLPRAHSLKADEVRAMAQADLDFSLAVYSLRGGLENRAVRFGEQLWKPIQADYVLELAPRQLVDLLYPVPFRESVLKHASPRNIDTRFLISIARQESRFQPDAKSVAAARGLMQFIPETANTIANQLRIPGFAQNQLYNPDTAILFGSQYLANLSQQFPGQPQAVAAAYNGGPDNVARWVSRSRSNEAERYVPEVGFSQTKDYVYKVMTNFWIYQQLYDEKLERR